MIFNVWRVIVSFRVDLEESQKGENCGILVRQIYVLAITSDGVRRIRLIDTRSSFFLNNINHS